ncbi:MAG: hypothetical protein ACLPX7_07535 [Xanthobacteraceae bacterium]
MQTGVFTGRCTVYAKFRCVEWQKTCHRSREVGILRKLSAEENGSRARPFDDEPDRVIIEMAPQFQQSQMAVAEQYPFRNMLT